MARKKTIVVGQPTRLSEAIVLGATFKPKARNAFFKTEGYDEECKVTGSCALAAAYEGIHMNPVVNTPGEAQAVRAEPNSKYDYIARETVYEDDPTTITGAIKKRFGVDVHKTLVPIPETATRYFAYVRRNEGKVDIYTLVVTLNDSAGWSREKIASYLAEQGY